MLAPAPALTEGRHQQEVVCWLNKHHRHLSDLLTHIPNGGYRSKVEAARLQAQGVKAGYPDLLLSIAAQGFHGLFIEMKQPTGKLKDAQKRIIPQLQAQGYRVEVCYTAQAAIDVLTDYLT